MPVVHDSHGSSSRRPSSRRVSSFGLARVALSPRASDGQNVQSWHVEPAPPTATAAENQPEAPGNSTKPTTLDRRGLIDRLKRAKSPTWLPPCGVSNEHVHGSNPRVPAHEDSDSANRGAGRPPTIFTRSPPVSTAPPWRFENSTYHAIRNAARPRSSWNNDRAAKVSSARWRF